MTTNLTQIIEQYAEATPSQDAVIEMRKNRIQRAVIRKRLGYGEFNLRINQFAAKFRKKGVTKGKRVLMLLHPGVEMMCTFFALVRLGAIPVLIDPGMGRQQFLQLANFSQPDYIICSGWRKWLFWLRIFKIQGKVLAIKRSYAKREKVIELTQDMGSEDTVAILFTSGSTGPAKGVVYKHKHFAAQLSKLRMTYKLVPNGRDVTLLPAFMLFNPMFGRTTIIPDMNFSKPATLHVPSVVETIANSCATSSFGAPVLWRKIAAYCLEHDVRLRSLEQIFLSGVSARIDTLEAIQKVAPNAKIFTPYGATECLPIASISADEVLGEIRPLQENGAGTCLGHPVEGIEIKILQSSDDIISEINEENTLALGFIGEIVVSGDNVTEAYDQLPEATKLAKIWENGRVWHRMGDVGFLDQKGRLWYCGRKSEFVETSDGETYYPDCIEPLFCKHPRVERSALIRYQKKGIIEPAIVVLPKQGFYPQFCWQKWTFRKELTNLAQNFPKTQKIHQFFFMKRLPVDPRHNAKIHRLKLAKQFSA